MSEGYVLSIDQGTTGTTVLVFDREANVRGRAYAEITQHYPRPGWVEHDPSEIWEVTMRVVAGALADAGVEARELRAVGLTNQRETAVLWDRATGEPLAPAIVWQDRRTADLCDRLRERGLEEDARARTGLIFDAYFSGTKVKWLLDQSLQRIVALLLHLRAQPSVTLFKPPSEVGFLVGTASGHGLVRATILFQRGEVRAHFLPAANLRSAPCGDVFVRLADARLHLRMREPHLIARDEGGRDHLRGIVF